MIIVWLAINAIAVVAIFVLVLIVLGCIPWKKGK